MEMQGIPEEKEWRYVSTLLPEDLEESSFRMGALIRRREIPNATALIRMLMAYGVCDLSLKDVAAWAKALGVAKISGPGLFYRVRESADWLEQVLGQVLEGELDKNTTGLKLRAVDATVINGPGAEGIDWRAHVLIDAGTGCIRSVELTDRHGGEKYDRYQFEAGEVILGDRAYAKAPGIYKVVQAGGHVVVRVNLQGIRLCDLEGRRTDLREWQDQIPKVGEKTWNMLLPIPPLHRSTRSHKPWKLEKAEAWIPVRVVGSRTKDGTPIWILTTLEAQQASSIQILKLYRIRWQIELLFKRLKTLLGLKKLPSGKGPIAKSWLLARFLAAAIVQKMVRPSGPLSPWGYELRSAGAHS